ncbi:DoxX family protein [Halolamina sp. CBA1230]|uniref:DoxX family protein n=1 Tax=Halolamina sp. CBA1230 TaxID=1853690 RepID=UPI0009A1E4F4|nr:DoxX family protein [Halolamina sp. CBA1230]QKY19212.1 DoxX family protein [Halolamina sp. CBA1230]
MSLLQAAALEGSAGTVFLLARLVFGLVLAFMGLNHFTDIEGMAGYAGSKGVPAPKFGVIASGVMLLLGGLGVAAGAYPVLAAGALATFFVVATPLMHDFWNAEDTQGEMTHFLKNVALLGASLAFLALGGVDWPLAANVGLF